MRGGGCAGPAARWPVPQLARLRRAAWLGAGGLGIAGLAPHAYAYGGEPSTAANAQSAWHFTPDIVIATTLFALIYAGGMARRRALRSSEIPVQ